MPPSSEPEYVNRQPDVIAPEAFARIPNREWLALAATRELTACQWRVLAALVVLQLGCGRLRAAADSCDGADAFLDARDDFGCEAVQVESWRIAQILDGEFCHSHSSKEQVRRALRQLRDANIIRVRRGKGGAGDNRQAQVISLNLDPTTWNPLKLVRTEDGPRADVD